MELKHAEERTQIRPERPRALILYSSYTGNTEKVAARFKLTFERHSWLCDMQKVRKREEDILDPKFDLASYDFLCVGSGIRSHLPYNEILNLLRRLRLGRDPRVALFFRGETIPYITRPMPPITPPGKDPTLLERHKRIVISPQAPRAVVFATYSGYEFGPKEAEPTLALLELEVEHLGFKCVGRFCCPGRYLDHPTPHTYHGDIRHRPDERDLLRAELFLEQALEEARGRNPIP